MSDKTLRSQVIRLAAAVPSTREHLLPLLVKSAAPKGTPVKEDIRHPFYEAGDKIGALEEAIKADGATKKDAKLLKAVTDLKKAHDDVLEALKPYAWD